MYDEKSYCFKKPSSYHEQNENSSSKPGASELEADKIINLVRDSIGPGWDRQFPVWSIILRDEESRNQIVEVALYNTWWHNFRSRLTSWKLVDCCSTCCYSYKASQIFELLVSQVRMEKILASHPCVPRKIVHVVNTIPHVPNLCQKMHLRTSCRSEVRIGRLQSLSKGLPAFTRRYSDGCSPYWLRPALQLTADAGRLPDTTQPCVDDLTCPRAHRLVLLFIYRTLHFQIMISRRLCQIFLVVN